MFWYVISGGSRDRLRKRWNVMISTIFNNWKRIYCWIVRQDNINQSNGWEGLRNYFQPKESHLYGHLYVYQDEVTMISLEHRPSPLVGLRWFQKTILISCPRWHKSWLCRSSIMCSVLHFGSEIRHQVSQRRRKSQKKTVGNAFALLASLASLLIISCMFSSEMISFNTEENTASWRKVSTIHLSHCAIGHSQA